MAIIASPIGTARIPTHGSCRTFVTASILTPRQLIDRNGNEIDVVTKGRHDPCVGIRAVPIGEAMMAIVLADHYLRHRAQCG